MDGRRRRAHGKAFLGITMNCAKCHDRKFDPVSQKEYFAVRAIRGAQRPHRAVAELDVKDGLVRAFDASLNPVPSCWARR